MLLIFTQRLSTTVGPSNTRFVVGAHVRTLDVITHITFAHTLTKRNRRIF
jgi:hypothetical protein